MNGIINKFSLAGDKFKSEMHLSQPGHAANISGITYSACGSFTKNKERILKFKETEDSRNIYQNEVDKACFQLDMAYCGFNDLTRRTASDKVSRDKADNIAKNSKYGYERGLTSVL